MQEQDNTVAHGRQEQPVQECHSEVARLMQQIALEYEAARRGCSGFAITARHAFITAHLENVERCHEQLTQHVGFERATHLLLQVSERVL